MLDDRLLSHVTVHTVRTVLAVRTPPPLFPCGAHRQSLVMAESDGQIDETKISHVSTLVTELQWTWNKWKHFTVRKSSMIKLPLLTYTECRQRGTREDDGLTPVDMGQY